MRMSTNIDDIGYIRDSSGVRVFLDGKLQEAVMTADEEQGYILKVVLDEDGFFAYNNGNIATEKYLGDVRIVMPADRNKYGNLYAK